MAVQEILSEKIAHPVLIGNKNEIETLQKQYKLELPELTIFDPAKEIDNQENRLIINVSAGCEYFILFQFSSAICHSSDTPVFSFHFRFPYESAFTYSLNISPRCS